MLALIWAVAFILPLCRTLSSGERIFEAIDAVSSEKVFRWGYDISDNVKCTYSIYYILTHEDEYEEDDVFHVRVYLKTIEQEWSNFKYDGMMIDEISELAKTDFERYKKTAVAFTEAFKNWYYTENNYKQMYAETVLKECERLKSIGYNVELYTAPYNGSCVCIDGYLTKSQLTGFKAYENYGYNIRMYGEWKYFNE